MSTLAVVAAAGDQGPGPQGQGWQPERGQLSSPGLVTAGMRSQSRPSV